MIWITALTLSLYLLAGFLLGRRLVGGVEGQQRSRTLPLILGLIAALLHSLLVYKAIITPEGLNLGFFKVLSLTTWTISLTVAITAFSQPIENLGIGVFPMAAMAEFMQQMLPNHTDIISFSSPGIELHILISILAASIFTVAAFQAGLLAIQDRHLRNRHPGGFVRSLPPLQTMETLLFRMIGIGYVLLSLSLVSGATFLENIWAQHLVHKTVLSIAAWAVFAILLWGRWRHGWRGRVAIRWTLWGFSALILAYFGSKLVQELILGRP